MSDVYIVQGESRIINVIANNGAGSPIDLTGATISWKAALAPYGTAVISKAGAVTNPPGVDGKFKVTLTPSDTIALSGNLYQSVDLVLDDASHISLFLGLIAIAPLTTTVSSELFKIRFPEFEPVSNARIQLFLAEALRYVDSSWLGSDQLLAQMYLTAHNLSVEGEPQRSTNGSSNTSTLGNVKSIQVGDVKTEFAGVAGGASGAGENMGDLGRTIYGQKYYEMLRANFAGAYVLGMEEQWPLLFP